MGVIDVIAHDAKTGEVVLVMNEPDEWDHSDERLIALQERFNAYVSFLLDGEMTSDHSELAGKPAWALVLCGHQGTRVQLETALREVLRRLCGGAKPLQQKSPPSPASRQPTQLAHPPSWHRRASPFPLCRTRANTSRSPSCTAISRVSGLGRNRSQVHTQQLIRKENRERQFQQFCSSFLRA